VPEAVIIAAARTPIGRAYKGSLTSVRADDLAVHAVRAALARVPELDPSSIDDLAVGTWLAAGEQGGNLARRVAVLLGLDSVPGSTTNRACTSSMQTTRGAFHAIRAGEGDVFVSAGVESVSRYPQPRAAGATADDDKHPAFVGPGRRSARSADDGATWHDPRDDDELPDLYIAMGITAENVATLRGVSRADQDAFAARSQQLAARATAGGFYAREIAPLTLDDGTVVDADDSPRPSTSAESLALLPAAFRAGGTVTAGNACPLNDGAAALVVTSAERAGELGIEPLARIVSTAVSALSPEIMGLGTVEASRRALDLAGLTASDLDLVEMNEAFAAVVLRFVRDMDLDLEKVNVNGGAIAMGHPLGATGGMILQTLIDELERQDKRYGLATLCVGGGMGIATVVERI